MHWKSGIIWTGIGLTALLTAGLIAQWAVDMSSAMRIQPNGAVTSVRYGSYNVPTMMTQLMPSESRYLNAASGYLPSENRMLRQQSVFLPSPGQASYLMPQYVPMSSNPLPVSAYVPTSSLRYGSAYGNRASRLALYQTYSTTAVLPPFSPNPTTGLAPSSSVPTYSASAGNWSIRYGRTAAASPAAVPFSSSPAAFASAAPYSSPVPQTASRSGLSAVSPASTFSPWPGTSHTGQSIRYGPSTTFTP